MKALIFSFLLLSCLANIVSAQVPKAPVISDINSPAMKRLSPEKYVDSVDKLLLELAVNGNYYSKDTLLYYLNTYKNYVWKYSRLEDRKANYFINIGNNASAQNKIGEAIYFFEKADRAYELYSKEKPGFVLMKLCYLHTQNKNFKKAIEVYEKELPRIAATPSYIRSKRLKGKDILLMMYILNPVASSYIFLKDTANTEKTISLAHDILGAIHSNSEVGHDDIAIMKFLYYGMMYYRDQHLLQWPGHTAQDIDSIRSLINDATLMIPLRKNFDNNLTEWQINYFISIKNVDSANYYIDKLRAMPTMMVDKHNMALTLKKHELKIWSLLNQNHQVSALIDDVFHLTDTINLALNNQLNDMMYAYTKAEYTEDELKSAEAAQRNRTVIIIVISLAAIVTTLSIYLRMRSRTKKIQKQISALNHLTNLKIAAMEASKQEAVRDEQERLAQELHDNFSATLAGLRHQTDHLYNSATDTYLKQKIEQVQYGLQHIYTSLRNTSHQWFFDARVQQQSSFHETIRFLLDSALPDEHYKKHIQIDANAVLMLSLDDRINILRIVQEATTNVIKHSKADEISVFLITTHTEIILQISDNGIGFHMEKGKPASAYGIGLQSIEKRAASLKGNLEIINEEGLLLNITINKNELAYFAQTNAVV